MAASGDRPPRRNVRPGVWLNPAGVEKAVEGRFCVEKPAGIWYK